MVHLLKGNIGTGIFAIPEGFRNAGMVVGSVGIPIIAVVVIHCMHILVSSTNVSQNLAVARGGWSGCHVT